MFFVIPSNKAKKEAEEDLFLHDKNATFHSASFHEIFRVHSSPSGTILMLRFRGEKLNPNSAKFSYFFLWGCPKRNNQSNQTANQVDLELCMAANKQKKKSGY